MNNLPNDLLYKVESLKQEFTIILDNIENPVEGELRVKLSRAELILNKIGKLLKEEENKK